MTDRTATPQRPKPAGAAEKTARAAAALRANLARRKAQKRARGAAEDVAGAPKQQG